MTQTLLLRLSGPMQSWGTRSRFRERDTEVEPSKSGVIGLLCAALGRPREAPLDDLASLRMGVRVLRPGLVRFDFQTAGGSYNDERPGVARAENSGGDTGLSKRSYLADAAFLVGFEGTGPEQEHLLQTLDTALLSPVWPLFLGRKSYLPDMPVRLPDGATSGPGLRTMGLEEALLDERLLRELPSTPGETRLVIECTSDDPDAEERSDWPVSFAPLDRRYRTRYVKVTSVQRPTAAQSDTV